MYVPEIILSQTISITTCVTQLSDGQLKLTIESGTANNIISGHCGLKAYKNHDL